MNQTGLTHPITTVDDIRELGTILTIWAHPDDETFTSAGILSTAAANGQTVICVTATRGELGSQDIEKWPLDSLGQVRSDELAVALRTLGISRHHWLGYGDGQCDRVSLPEARAKLAAYFDRYKPDTILTFGPDGTTGHPDHCAVSAWVHAAAGASSHKPSAIYHYVTVRSQYDKYFKAADEKFNIFFNIDRPVLKEPAECDIYFELPPEACRKKCQAFEDMPSQYAGMCRMYSTDQLSDIFGVEAFIRAG